MRTDKKSSHKADKKPSSRGHKQGVVGYSKKSALLEEAITHMNTGKYGRSSAALKELLSLDPQNTEARRLFATLHLRLGSLVTAREAFEALANEAIGRQDYWLAESLLREYLAAGPRCIPFLELLANVYQEKGDEMAAVAELGKAIEILLEDPDPDNPKKPAQLYSKIRELAPASPVAFQFASSFDIQTGEFRITPPAAPSPTLTHEPPQSPSASSLPQSDQAVVQPEVMPWEQIDEPPAGVPSHLSSTPVTELPEVQVQLPMPMAEEPLASAPVSFEAAPINESSSATTSPLSDMSAPQAELAPLDPVSAQPLPEVELNLVSQENSSAILEPDLALSTTIEPTLEAPQGSPSDSGGAAEKNALPSRMPWEHVADAALEIIETESSVAVPLSLDPGPVLSTDPELSPVPSSQPEPAPVSFKNLLEEPLSKPDAAPPEQPAAVEAANLTEPSTAPEPESTLPKSFSWNAIFDSAWKIAVGTTAPSSSVTVKDPEETAPLESSKEVESAKLGSSVFEEESAREFTLVSSSESPGSVEIEPQPTAHAEPLESVSTTITIVSSSDQPSMSPLARQDEVLPESHGSSPIAVQEEEPFPEPLASPADPILESVVEPQTVPLQSERQEIAQPVTPTPVFFSPASEEPLALQPSRGESVRADQVEPPAPPVPSSSEFALAPNEPRSVLPVEAMPTVVPSPVVPAPAKAEPPVSEPEPSSTPKTPSPWSTGEVAVQLHRPSAKKKQWEKEPSPVPEEAAAASPPFQAPPALSEDSQAWEASAVEAPDPIIEEIVQQPVDTRPEWAQATDSITLSRTDAPSPQTWDAEASGSFYKPQEPPPSAAVSAVDVLFGSTGRDTQGLIRDRVAAPRPRPWIAARLARLRQNVSSFIGSCFSTTRAVVLLCVSLIVLSVVTVAVGAGMLALAWIVMEEPPTARYQSLTNGPQRLITDHTKNGYLLLLGIDAPAGQDPNQAGYERKLSEQDDAAAQSCMLAGESNGGAGKGGASSSVVNGWFKGTDPLAQLKGQAETVKSLIVQESTALARYQQWLTMPFDDWGYGKILSPNCSHVLLAHRLFLLDGFSQDTMVGLGRLEKDMDSWRAALGQSKTLMMKMLAAAAVQDDVTIASGLLVRPETDAATVSRLAKVVRPLDQLELSIRWPMQSHFVWATGSVAAELKKDRSEERPFHVALAAAMPLPIQRRANAYAEYYDAANKAVAEGRYASLPKASTFMRTSASSIVDYWANPIEHIVGIQPLPSWDPYVGRMVETDAQLRLASLQAWVRRGPQDGDFLARLAKAGQAYYDPFTGLPMLVNQQKRLLYSVGMDGKDQEGDRVLDVVVAIPAAPASSNDNKRSAK